MRTVIIDYDSGNLHSAEKAFQRMAREHEAGEVIVTSSPEDVARADRIVLPGDGAFPACKQQLDDHRGIFEAIDEAVMRQGRPFMGICVGMQMLASVSREYQDTDGFGWIPGEVVKITPSEPSYKVPHMGWNDLVIDTPHPLLDGIETGAHVYFVHSYHMKVDNPAQRLAHCDYAGDITAIVGRDNIVGTQFHPEKSQATGLRMIANFLTWKP
ncbi:Imidazole glycerol phosphate synthase subunit HisH [Aliiroseovarius sp. xm-m-379]|uniref:imidazole glycerol phosphate synthase subunit HisH n=1 Tax=unclassified Aliiroseovarius TaxID=2623558 RepID=UPI00156A50E3|nr:MULTISPECIES: imidazole glycerol phosphate synthase subunit HisH [unclassified Aliiroseovarius]NRP12582.1 Imidazole glycerol phosphate synthase subunit HisH [Aliiroseovarius sp. xm-d-517]NRP26243.1 Imidazole glycerol phosphate synthase subunit HisH [Aliiroseovarius sp. xm-m-379]NRP31810.1 Imidazole glycerol phosphate synthase subunit HisH [Aliiroseovarius sp. xm-m-314]NRP35042.1 Imidazole glycerol phosphate synthase subunit HisH [Aliiroseovarius sp. xm-a-104]NRP42535.1 Imidazole glycerol ph